MSELTSAMLGSGVVDISRATGQSKFVDNARLSGFEKEMTPKSMLEQAGKMLGLMGTIKDGQTVEMVGPFAQDKTKIKIVGKGSENASEIEYGYLDSRYRKLEKEALKSRQQEREQVEIVVAMHLGQTLSEMHAKFVDTDKDYLAKNTKVDLWSSKNSRKKPERIESRELIERFGSEKIGFVKAISNLKKVYGSNKLATEKYINQMAIGKVFGKAFAAQAEKTADMVRQAELLDVVPDEKKGFWNRLQKGANAIKQAINKPLAPVEATAKAVVGLALYDANPLAHGKIGNFIEKLWAETPISTVIPGAGHSMREAAARLEEMLIVDPLTGEGVRTGPITSDKIREASVAGAEWAVKMQVLPGLMAKLPAIEALSLNPGEIYSTLRSSRMVKSGAGSVRQIASRLKEAWDEKDGKKMAKISAWGAGSAVGFYLAEKLSPVVGGVNPVLMGDIALMRLAGEVEKYSSGRGLEKTEMAETLETIEAGITVAFAGDSATSIGERLATLVETGSTNPVAQIKTEDALLDMVEQHPEYLRGDLGGTFGDIRRFEHEVIQEIKGIEAQDNPWQTFTFKDNEIIHVDPGSDANNPVVIKQVDDHIFEWRDNEWVEAVIDRSPEIEDDKDVSTVEQVIVETEKELSSIQSVHDYVYYEPGSTKMAFRMDLVPGETWEQKVDRLFEGYAAGGIDDPSVATNYQGKDIQAMLENTPELRELTGDDGVYERQIHDMLINRLISDATTNGLVYDEDLVKSRLVDFLEHDTTVDVDTVEGEVDYGQLYQNLFLGSQVTGNVGDISTELYQPYFLSGNEGTSHGVEVNITIPEGGSVLTELAKQGYGSGNGQIYDPKSEVLPDAKIIKLNPDGTETVISNFAELDLVHPDDKFVVRTGVGGQETIMQGQMPDIIALPDSMLSSWELPPSEQEAVIEKQIWMKETVRNDAGEIYMGVVGDNSDFTHMMFGKFGDLMDNPWDALTVFQNMDVNGVSVYALTLDANGQEVSRRTLNSYDDLRTLYTGETIIVDDPNNFLSDVPDLDIKEVELDRHPEAVLPKDDVVDPALAPKIVGFTDDGKLDLDNPPETAVRDSEGLIYVGQIKDGTWLSMLVSSHLPTVEGIDTWQQVNDLYSSGQIEILKVDENGQLVKIEDVNLVDVGDQIVIKDVSNLLVEVKNISDVNVPVLPELPLVSEDPILPIVHEESETLPVEEIRSNLEKIITEMGDDVNVGLTVIDLDNASNFIEIGNHQPFSADKAQELAIAMAVLRLVDSEVLDLEAESRFVVLPGDYKPSLEHLLKLMITHDDPAAKDGLLKELVGQDMDILLGEDTGLKEILGNSVTTTGDAAKIYQTLLRTTYLSDESRDLLQDILGKDSPQIDGLLSYDLSSMTGVEVVELANSAEWAGIVGGEQVPEYSTFAQVSTPDGREFVVVMTADSSDAEQSRSVFRTVARELARELGQGSNLLPENELVADVAKQITGSEKAQLDYVNHTISPYRMETGEYVIDPVIKAQIKDIGELDLLKFDNQVATYADGSGTIHLEDFASGRAVSVFVDSKQRVSMVLDSQDLAESSIGYEVYVGGNENPKFVEDNFASDTQQLKLNISLEVATDTTFFGPVERAQFIDSVREAGNDYDFYLFAADPGSNGATIVYGRDGDRRDLGSLPTNVNVAIVTSGGNAQLQNNQTQTALDLLVDKLGTTKVVTDIVWQEQGTSYSEMDDAWDNMQGHWFDDLRDVSWENQAGVTANTVYDNSVFTQVVTDTLGVTVDPSVGSVMIDGVNYLKAAFIPEGMILDRAVVARSNEIDINNLIITPTNDVNVYLIGESVSADKYDDPEIKATFEHPSDELIFQYQEGDHTVLSDVYDPTPERPLISVYPLERPLDTYLDTDRLILLSDKEKVNLQYQGEPYFVLSSEGARKNIYVDPYNMVSYAKSGEDFIPLVTDSHKYSEMAEIYGLEGPEAVDIPKLWEQRVSDAMMLEAREAGTKIVSDKGSLVIYDDNGSFIEKVLTIKHNANGDPMVDTSGHIILESTTGELQIFDKGKFIIKDLESARGIDEYLQGYEYVTSDDGVPLQYRGFPILGKGELLYIVSQQGVVLVGSKSEFNLEGFVADQGVSDLLDSWDVVTSTTMDFEEKSFADYSTQSDKIVHDLVVSSERLIEVENGVVDLQSSEKYLVPSLDSDLKFDPTTGRIVFTNTIDSKQYVWSGDGWKSVVADQLVSKEEYLKLQGLTLLEDELNRGEVIDRRTEGEVYVKEGWAYSLDSEGLTRIGQVDAVIKAGFIGYLDSEEKFQTYTPTSLMEMYGNEQYTVAEKISFLFNPIINSVFGMNADIVNLWADCDIKDVLPTIKKENYVGYEDLPPEYISALLAQENKTLYRASEGEATNLDLGVLVKVVLSGGERGGSTLVQGLVKNLLMSPEDRLERSIGRKISELIMADQLLETMSPEEIVAMYANTVSYGSINGVEITGVGQAAETLFGKDVHDLDLVEMGLLVAVPNYPTRNNLMLHENAEGWADSASGVYRHMYENGFITEAEMQQAFLDVHEKILSTGQQSDIDYLLSNKVIQASDIDWIKQAAADYEQLGFEERKLVEIVTESTELQLGMYGLAGSSVVPLAPSSVGVEPIVKTETVVKYADFFDYLHTVAPDKFTVEQVDLANENYYWYGKVPAGDEVFNKIDYLAIDGDINVKNIGISYTTREFDPDNPNYTPQAEIDKDKNVAIDPWAHRYEAMKKDESGNIVNYSVVATGADGVPLVQDENGGLWTVTESGLVRQPGRVYQIEGGGAVQAMPANDRPGMLVDGTGSEIIGSRFVRDTQGNYFRVIDGTKVDYVGQTMTLSDGRNVLFELDANTSFEVAPEPKNFLMTAVKNMLVFRGAERAQFQSQSEMPTSNDPNLGYVLPRGQGEYGLINPSAAEIYLEGQGIASEAVEIAASRHGRDVFEKFITELVVQDRSVVVWLNNDMASDVIKVDNEGKTFFETISRHEQPVSVLQIFEFEGDKYVAYQDPTQASPQVLSFDRFAQLASPSDIGRYKTLVMGDYELSEEYKSYLYDPRSQANQVGVLVEDGHVYDYANPGEIEGMMSINPGMQEFVAEAAKNLLSENDASGVVFIGMDPSTGRIPFYGAINAEGEFDPEMAGSAYQPGSIYKLATAMWALNSGVDPSASLQAGDWYQWAEGDKTYNWTMDPVTGQLRYNSGADTTMTMKDALRESNNPYFLGIIDNAADVNAFSDYARSIGFGDGQVAGNIPYGDAVVSDTRDGEYSYRDIAYSAIGQGRSAMSVVEYVTFVSALANNGTVVEPTLARELSNHGTTQLPNSPGDYSVIAEAMHEVVSDPNGTAYQSFGDVENYGYTVYGKTGTAETGGVSNAWFVGWAVDKTTGEKLSFAFLIPNGGEGSRVAAPLAREVLDKYFSDLRANEALKADSAPFVVEANPREIIETVAEVERGVVGFNLENQPNAEFIKFAIESTEVANQFRPSSEELRDYDEGLEFITYMKDELTKRGYADVMNSPSMNDGYVQMLQDYESWGSEDNEQPVQCSAWQTFLSGASGHLAGAPIKVSLPGNADAVVGLVMSENLQTGDPSSLDVGGTIVRFNNDRADISLFEPGDAFFIRYKINKDEGNFAHTGVILATGRSETNEQMVLVSDSNRFRDEQGNIVTNGLPRVRWLTQSEFTNEYEREGDAYAGIAPSEIVAVRLNPEDQVRSIFDENYHSSANVDLQQLPWSMETDTNGNLVLPFENSIHLLEHGVGEMKPIESIYIHWSGADSTDTSTWTAEMVKNGLDGEQTSATFAVGVDGIWQLAKMEPGKVQETYATPWRNGVINIEIAGQDFDNNPPSKEEYQNVVELTTELLISANKPISILKPHYDEIYLWSPQMPKMDGTPGNWVLIDSEDLTKANYFNDETQSWDTLDTFEYDYETTIQKKVDPGEKFFAQLQADVRQRLVDMGRTDLLSNESAMVFPELGQEDLSDLRIIDKAHPITNEEINNEITPYLVIVDSIGPVLAEAAVGEDAIRLHEDVVPDLTEMISASRDENIGLYLSSGFRSFSEQSWALAASWGDTSLATIPGESQHHTGRAIDFTSSEEGINFVVDMDAGFENSEAGKWLWENGWKYGFVQSYTKNHDGVQNEPWHYYYLGRDLAKIWYESQLTDKPLDAFEIMEQATSTQR